MRAKPIESEKISRVAQFIFKIGGIIALDIHSILDPKIIQMSLFPSDIL